MISLWIVMKFLEHNLHINYVILMRHMLKIRLMRLKVEFNLQVNYFKNFGSNLWIKLNIRLNKLLIIKQQHFMSLLYS